MQHRLIKQGTGGFTIYLPKHWVQARGLKPKDEINIEETETGLLVGAPVQGKKSITIAVTEENKPNLQLILTHLYRVGFDVITITGIDASSFRQIEQTTHLLLGFEVISKDKASCTIESVTEAQGERFDVLVRRIFLMIQETQRVVSRDISEGALKNMEEIGTLRQQVDKLVLFLRRLINKKAYEGSAVLMWELLVWLMHIEHSYYYFYQYAASKRLKRSEAITTLLHDLESYFALFADAYLKKDIDDLYKMMKLKDRYQYGKCYEGLEKARGADAVLLSHIRETFRLIQIGSSPVLANLLDESILLNPGKP